jgi:Interferon-induced transmembrane protein
MGYPQQYPPQGQPPQIDNNMTMSIVSIFLFWPLAIPAIIAASKVNPALQVGDYATAQQSAADSKKWSKLALIIGLCWYGLSIVCCIAWFAFVASSATTSSY